MICHCIYKIVWLLENLMYELRLLDVVNIVYTIYIHVDIPDTNLLAFV